MADISKLEQQADVKKALECHAHRTERNLNCCDCDYIQHQDCSQRMSCDALDLINRQKAEIERLQSIADSFTDIGKLYSEIKSEAYKEFAERLKEKFAIAIIKNVSVEFALGYKTAFIDITNNIDNLLKELEGDNDEQTKKND